MMKTIALLVGSLVLVSAALAVGGDEGKTPTIKEVMGKLNKGPKSALGQLKGKLSAADPDWKEIEKLGKEFEVYGAALGKNDPPKGDKESWKKLTDAYYADSKALDEAAKARDKAAAAAAHKKLATSCKSCHQAHKG